MSDKVKIMMGPGSVMCLLNKEKKTCSPESRTRPATLPSWEALTFHATLDYTSLFYLYFMIYDDGGVLVGGVDGATGLTGEKQEKKEKEKEEKEKKLSRMGRVDGNQMLYKRSSRTKKKF